MAPLLERIKCVSQTALYTKGHGMMVSKFQKASEIGNKRKHDAFRMARWLFECQFPLLTLLCFLK